MPTIPTTTPATTPSTTPTTTPTESTIAATSAASNAEPSAESSAANRPLSQSIERDEEGYLLYTEDWSEPLAHELAREQGLVLPGERREIVLYIRDYFESHQTVPEARTLLKHMKQIWGAERATRKYLYSLFPRGYGQQACKIAGMRKPRKLMLDV